MFPRTLPGGVLPAIAYCSRKGRIVGALSRIEPLCSPRHELGREGTRPCLDYSAPLPTVTCWRSLQCPRRVLECHQVKMCESLSDKVGRSIPSATFNLAHVQMQTTRALQGAVRLAVTVRLHSQKQISSHASVNSPHSHRPPHSLLASAGFTCMRGGARSTEEGPHYLMPNKPTLIGWESRRHSRTSSYSIHNIHVSLCSQQLAAHSEARPGYSPHAQLPPTPPYSRKLAPEPCLTSRPLPSTLRSCPWAP